MGMEDDFLLEDEDDEKTIEFIKNYLPQDMKEACSDFRRPLPVFGIPIVTRSTSNT